jgi:predicted methyltransferase
MASRLHILLATTALLGACQAEQATPQNETAAIATPAGIPSPVAAALADPGRAAQAGADARRKPGELVAFSGLKAGDKVLDLIPGDGYWTRIFSKLVRPQGHVFAVWPKNYAEVAQGNLATLRQIAASPDYPNVTVEVQPGTKLTATEPLDMVWTSQNYHDYPDEFMGRADPAELNKAVFAMLKPGGTFLIIDHAAAPGSAMRDTDTLHRIDPATVRQQVEAAGFEFVGDSPVLANPADDHTLKVFDPKVRGHTDQFAMRFRKPG